MQISSIKSCLTHVHQYLLGCLTQFYLFIYLFIWNYLTPSTIFHMLSTTKCAWSLFLASSHIKYFIPSISHKPALNQMCNVLKA